MLNEYLEELQKLDKPWFYRVAWAGGVILFLLAALLWWNYASVTPERVFWGTVNNNLVLNGVTKQVVTNEINGSMNQTQQISLGAQNVVTGTTTVEQKASDAASTKVVTETIATPTVDFAKYVSIETAQPTGGAAPNFGDALNIWSKQEVTKDSGGAFTEALYGLIPLGFVQGNQRANIVKDMQKNQVYDVQYDKLQKRREHGRLMYDYTIAVNPEQYMKTLKQIDAAMGLNQLEALDPSQYTGAQALEVRVTIDAHAQQLVSVTYPENSRIETYSGYGIFRSIELPQNATPRQELQNKLNTILNAQT